MIHFLEGKFHEISPTLVVINCGGVGYEVKISLNTYEELVKTNANFVFTQFIVREDAQILYGFATKEEREVFNLLISVSGIGPSTAMIMLSSLKTGEIAHAIVHEDIRTVQSIKGIGAKTAQRVIIELKDKMLKLDVSTENSSVANNTMRFDALSALLSLGFDRKAIDKAMDKIDDGNKTVEILIKEALKIL
ncbi:MAG TPA: Holliday junction branch migration protein RuvA [Crocinitomicaceae bacterium]|nr:Holliday junction branch migration protein RuvA [Crocinitomicaceae bacterium]